MIFGPNPPPTNGAITRTWRSLRPSMPARPLRRNTGAWVVSQIVSWPARASQLRDDAARLDRGRRAVVVAKAAPDHVVGFRRAAA